MLMSKYLGFAGKSCSARSYKEEKKNQLAVYPTKKPNGTSAAVSLNGIMW